MKFNAAFWKWFGDSKVVDAKGRPLVVYHASSSKAILSFDISRCEFGCHFGTYNQAKTIADNSGLSDENIFPFYLSIEHPLRLQDEGGWKSRDLVGQLLGLGLVKKSQIDSAWRLMVPSKRYATEIDVVRDYIIKLGYDGIVSLNRAEGLSKKDRAKIASMDDGETDLDYIFKEIGDGEFERAFPSARDSWIAFSPSQIKSSIGNDGTWDADDADTRSNPDEVEFLPYIKSGMKGILFDGEFIAWEVDSKGSPHHDDMFLEPGEAYAGLLHKQLLIAVPKAKTKEDALRIAKRVFPFVDPQSISPTDDVCVEWGTGPFGSTCQPASRFGLDVRDNPRRRR